MDLTPYTQKLRDDLLTAASIGDEDTRRAAALLASAIEPAARLAIMDALSELATEVTQALGDTIVELRLDGREVKVSVTPPDVRSSGAGRGFGIDQFFSQRFDKRADSGDAGQRDKATSSGPTPDGAAHGADEGHDSQSAEELRRAMQDAGGELSRTTVRLFNELKSQAERAASEQGVSLNTYISRAVSDSVRSAVPGKGSRGHDHRGPDGGSVTGFIRG